MSVCKRVFSVGFGPQCLPQGAGAPPAMMRGRMTGFPKNWGPRPPERQDKVDTICTVSLDCGTPTTRRLYPFGALGYNHAIHRKRYQGTQSLHNIEKSHIHPTSIQHPSNINLKRVFSKLASFHPHYLTFT